MAKLHSQMPPSWLAPVVSLVSLVLLGLHLAGKIVVDVSAIALMGLVVGAWLFPLLSKFKIGDIEFELKKIEAAQQALAEVNAEPSLPIGNSRSGSTAPDANTPLSATDKPRPAMLAPATMREPENKDLNIQPKEIPRRSPRVPVRPAPMSAPSDPLGDPKDSSSNPFNSLSPSPIADFLSEIPLFLQGRPSDPVTEVELVLDALSKGKYRLRTVEGLARDTGIKEARILELLKQIEAAGFIVRVEGQGGRTLVGLSAAGQLIVRS